ncbi:crotonase/enoyl-CoA hydratase family protein [Pseudovibrio sp. SPO723]|uniref:crotonase/enoyl-CoA hydratase family protein n=1 Tax=Nesiotobacter zosterae TaxID=392721 RepID=UPI0029C308A7|nr:crotonase/enoyl-CoA hydratase family protein [Pseudovibrio sp. SPO723]MDX5592438.1 crotonase/enoyl-CoA hydratase family protein [Pseudovibrio sp. SPO723]
MSDKVEWKTTETGVNFASASGLTAPGKTETEFSRKENASVAEVSLSKKFASVHLESLDLEYDEDTKALWVFMKGRGRPCFSPELLGDLAGAQVVIKRLYETYKRAMPEPIRYNVIASRNPHIYNLGGDLGLFIDLIKRGDRSALEKYAVDCIDVVYGNAVSLDLPYITIGLVQGDALGGGFETALSCDVIIAERQAKFGLPEVLFNLFPGMGAYSFLCRKVDGHRAEEMMLSGRLYSAEELQELGLVDLVVDEGQGVAATQDYIQKNGRKYNAHSAIYRSGRAVQPITYKELRQVVDIWVEAAMQLSPSDLRKMERLTKAQNRFESGGRGTLAL